MQIIKKKKAKEGGEQEHDPCLVPFVNGEKKLFVLFLRS